MQEVIFNIASLSISSHVCLCIPMYKVTLSVISLTRHALSMFVYHKIAIYQFDNVKFHSHAYHQTIAVLAQLFIHAVFVFYIRVHVLTQKVVYIVLTKLSSCFSMHGGT